MQRSTVGAVLSLVLTVQASVSAQTSAPAAAVPPEPPIYFVGKNLTWPPLDTRASHQVAAPAQRRSIRRSANAPADEYFGHLQMSVLGLRNFLHDTEQIGPDMSADLARDILHKMLFVEDSFRDWQAKYPRDTWIVRLGSQVSAAYAKLDMALPDDEPHVAAQHRINLAGFMDKNYPVNQISTAK